MKKLTTVAAIAACSIFAGCRVVEVENNGEGVLTDKDGRPLLADGKPILYSKGWSVYHNQHWMITGFDALNAWIRPDDIGVNLNGYKGEPSAELRLLVETSLKGAAELAAKIGAAIATSGGSAGADAIIGWVRNFVKAGGDPSKATIKCENGSCTFTDGNVTCTDGSCTYVE